MRTILIATALLVASLSASFAQTPPPYNPGRKAVVTEEPQTKTQQAPATKAEASAPKRDYQAEAKQRFDGWLEDKRKCYLRAGIEEGKHFRLPPGATTFRINDIVYTDSRYNGKAVEACNQ